MSILSFDTLHFNSVISSTIQIIKFTILLCFLFPPASVSESDTDWSQDCGICHCHWNSGKKKANCKNRTIIDVPTDLTDELQVIDLSFNQLIKLRNDVFYNAGLHNLHKIYVKNCALNELNRDSFKGLVVLFELDLSNNYIRVLPVGIFSTLYKLRNFLMNHNEIEILESKLFSNMKFLSRVEFKHNRIKRIETNAFINVENLSLLYLESNRLAFLGKETFENITKLKDLTLASNPWNCSCKLQQFRDFLIEKNLYTPPTDCTEPAQLKDKLWSDIASEYFACKPRITFPKAQSYIETSNENLTIICRLHGSPKPHVFWLFNKRSLSINDPRIQIHNAVESHPKNNDYMLVSKLSISGLKTNDRGTYSCVAENHGGQDKVDVILVINLNTGTSEVDAISNFLLMICLLAIILLLLLIVVALVLCWHCRKMRRYSKEATMSENGLITLKLKSIQNGSVPESSVIMEMQKNLLTEINPTNEMSKRTQLEDFHVDKPHSTKKVSFDEILFASHDEETNSFPLEDKKSKFPLNFDKDYYTKLPPDLLLFPAQHVPEQFRDYRVTYGKLIESRSPSCQNILLCNDQSPQAAMKTLDTIPIQFSTLQYQKSKNLTNNVTEKSTNPTNNFYQSPFIAKSAVYPLIILKPGCTTSLPCQSRQSKWMPVITSPLSEFQERTINSKWKKSWNRYLGITNS